MTGSYVLTFGSTAVQLSSVLTTGQEMPVVSFLSLQPLSANSNVMYVGGSNSGSQTSSTNFGVRLEAPASTIPPAPFILEIGRGNIALSDVWIKGTSGEKVAILYKY